MRSTAVLSAAAVLAAASLVFAADSSNNPPQQPQQNQQSRQSNSQQQSDRSPDNSSANASGQRYSQKNAPEGWVLLDQRIVYLMAKEPQAHLLQAHLEMSKDPKAAASECRIAADYLDMQATQARQQQDQSRLQRCAKELRSFADQIGNKSAKQQDATRLFARVNYTLARTFNDDAEQALKQDKLVPAGHDLDSAAESFRQCLVWSSQRPQQQTAQAIDKAASLAPALIMAPHAEGGEAQAASNRQTPSDLKQQAQQASQDLARQLEQCKSQFQSNKSSSHSNNSNSNNGASKT